jgi:dipeptidyl aminopeptidase/acylaminoacyl peptidase
MIPRNRKTILAITVGLLFSATGLMAQDPGAKQPLPIDDYERWRSITSTAVSDDGEWLAYAYRKREADDSLYVNNRGTGQEYLIPCASGLRFSEDSKWAAYMVTLPFKEAEKLREDNNPVPNKAELLNLQTGEKISWDNAASFGFAESSTHFAVKKAKVNRRAEHDGTDLILRNLEEGYEELIGSVAAYSFNKPGTMLAYTVDTADKDGNGLYLIFLDSDQRRPLDNGKVRYERMTWDEEGTALAVLKGDEKEGFEERENVLLVYTELSDGRFNTFEYDPAETNDFPEGMVISEKGSLSWNEDATRVFFGIKEQKEKEDEESGRGGRRTSSEEPEDTGEEQAATEEKEKEEDPVADVDIWHWQDEQIQSVQMIRASQDRNRTHSSVFNLETEKFVRLTDDEMRTISVTRDGRWGIGQNNREYLSDWEERRADYYRVDINTGERVLFMEGHISGLSSGGRRGGGATALSPDSRHFLFWEDGHIWDYVIETGAKTNLTQNAPVDFTNQEYDNPGKKPPYGLAGWTEDGDAIILNHRYDLWLQPLDGSEATNLTGGRGAEDEIVFRYIRTDPETRTIDLSDPVLLSAYGEWTKKAGFFQLRRRRLTELVFEDRNFGRPVKAEEADKFIFTIQTFRDYPDFYISGDDFSGPVRFTDANPQISEYKWGNSILFDFTNNDGVRLQGWLGIPEDYQEGQRLPMLVNYYEKNSRNLHRFPTPRYSGSPNLGGYLSNGYLVMQPDIHLRTRTTHSDMAECVEAAVKKVIEMGYADPDRVAVHGGSFSGQGSAYIATHSDLYAAIVYRAGATNLVSDFNQLWKSAGTNQHRYDIYGQGRFGTNPFDDLELFIEQSAVHHARNMNTPLLLQHGTDDGSVEWLQAIEFYNALRFNDKPVILLSYPGEGHSLRKYENQLDYQKRARQFLDHHLKGAPAPEWMISGRRFIDKPEKEQ